MNFTNEETKEAQISWCLVNLDTLRASVVSTSRPLYDKVFDGVKDMFKQLQAEIEQLKEDLEDA